MGDIPWRMERDGQMTMRAFRTRMQPQAQRPAQRPAQEEIYRHEHNPSLSLQENREDAAAARMSENRRIKTLTPEQHDTLEELASLRHEIHTSAKDMYNPENINGEKGWKRLYEINSELNRLKLGELELLNPEDYPTSEDRSLGLLDDDSEESEEENRTKFFDMMEDLNNQMERILRNIDERHNTHYAPGGFTRE